MPRTIAVADPSDQLDFHARKGIVLNKVLTVYDELGDPFDFTGYSATLKLYNKPGGTEILDIGLALASGQITMSKAAAAMDIAADEYYYEFFMTYPDTSILPWTTGIFRIHAGVYDQEDDRDEIQVIENGTPITINVKPTLTAASLPLTVKSYTVATLPDATMWTASIIYVSDEAGGATLAFSDGANWRRSQDRAIVS